MSDVQIHQTIAEKYEVTTGFIQKGFIPGIGFRDLAVTPLHVVAEKIKKGVIQGLKKKEVVAAAAEITEVIADAGGGETSKEVDEAKAAKTLVKAKFATKKN